MRVATAGHSHQRRNGFAEGRQGRVHTGAEFEPGTQRPGYPETVFLDNTPLKPVDALSKVVPGTFYFDYAADKIYIADNPTGHAIEAGKLTDAFHGSATNVTVQNLVIEKYDPQIQDGAIQGGRGWTIQNNEVRLNYAVGIIGEDGSKLIGNYVHDNGQMGLGGFGDNILVQGNEIAKNGYWSGIDVLWEGGGFKFANTDNLVVRGNYSHDNNGIGMWTDIDNIHTLYEDNVVVHNGMGGISHEISYQAIIRNNTLIGNGADDPRSWWWGNEIQIQNSQNVEVYGNRVEMTGGGNGIVIIQQNRGSGTFGTHTTTGNQIHDNIIVDHDGEGYIGGVADYNQSGRGHPPNLMLVNPPIPQCGFCRLFGAANCHGESKKYQWTPRHPAIADIARRATMPLMEAFGPRPYSYKDSARLQSKHLHSSRTAAFSSHRQLSGLQVN